MKTTTSVMLFSILLHSLLPAPCRAAAPAGKSTYELIDLTDDYSALAARSAQDTAGQVAAFKAEIVPQFREFYGRERFGKRSDAEFDARIAASFAAFPKIRERYTATATAFRGMFEPALQDFERALPGLRALPPIYLLHSLGEMDGGTRGFTGGTVLIFGADVMATHEFTDERPFLHHELFHVYHQQFFTGCEELWCSLWSEGLAVYAAQQLNPTASDGQLLLTQPEPIRAKVDANLARVVCKIRTLLDSKAPGERQGLFSFERFDEVTPPRAGYYVGYLAARRAGTRQSLDALARLSNNEAKSVVSTALAEVVTCP